MGVALTALALWLLLGHTEAGPGVEGVGSARTIVSRDGTAYHYRARVRRGAVLSVGVGFVSSFLGIGGGVVHVPLMVAALGFPTHVATATSHFVLAFMALVATITHILSGSFQHGVGLRRAASLSVGVVIGAQVGARVSRLVSGRRIQQLLAGGLLVLGVRLILSVAI
jgi:uncharacterized membrane protein YfcA